MLRLSRGSACCVVFFWATVCAGADKPVISVRGFAHQMFEPDTVRVRFRVYSHGMTAASALGKLDAGQALLEKRLKALGEPRPVHQFGPRYALREDKDKSKPMQVIVQNMMQGGNDDEENENLIRLVYTVTLEWKLTGDSLDAHYRRLDLIRDQLEEIHVTSPGNDSKKDDAEGESREEAIEEEEDPAESPAAKLRFTDGPRYYFIRHLKEAEADASAERAFQDAKRRASRLARAAGGKLGSIVRLSEQVNMNQIFTQRQNNQVTFDMMFGTNTPSFEEDAYTPPLELVSEGLKPIEYKAEITAVFSLE
ncbi:MAG: SIMPL domain-containing protein [Phycisphaerae bacterium]